MKIGFIGLGLMGSRMATNIQKNGYELVVYNRSWQKMEKFVQEGAVAGQSPAELAEKVDVLFTMLSSPSIVEKMAIGEKGFLSSIKTNSIWIDCSTVNPSFSRKMADMAGSLGVRFIDAPAAGSIGPAQRGELTFFVGGSLNDLKSVENLLLCMSKKIVHVGENGMGSSMKMVNNTLLGLSMISFCEALALGEEMGITKEMLLDTLLEAPVTAPYLSTKREKFEKNSFDPEFSLKMINKDFHLVAQTAFEKGIAMPTTNAAKEIYSLCQRLGLGEEDFSAIYKLLMNKCKCY